MGQNKEIKFKGHVIGGTYGRHADPMAPLLVFLHGFPDDANSWSYQISGLKDLASIWAPDLYLYSFEDQLKLVKEGILSHAGSAPVYLVAHDMGGPIAFELAQKNSGLFKDIFFINTLGLEQLLGRVLTSSQLLRSSYMFLFFGPMHEPVRWKLFGRIFLKKAYDSGGLPMTDDLRKNSLVVLEGVKRYRELLKLSFQKKIKFKKPITVPTHFYFAKDDPFLLVPSQAELEKYFHHATLETNYGGHWIHRTKQDLVTVWIKRRVFT